MEVHTLNQLYRNSIARFPRPAMFRYKDGGRWVEVSSEDFAVAVREVAHGLLSLGIEPGDRVALLSENRLEWAMADLAVLGVGAIVVPVYPTLMAHQIEYILGDCKPSAMFCSTPEQVQKMDEVFDRIASLRTIISFEPADRAEAMTLAKLRELGRVNLRTREGAVETRANAVDPEQPATIIYTSGTTGQPKGVVLTHRNIVSNVLASLSVLDLHPTDNCLSFLPLSHILERMAGYYVMLHGGVSITYAESVETVAADMGEVKPTVMISVPRLYEKIYTRVLNTASQGSPTKRKIFFWAKEVGARYTEKKVAGEAVGFGLKVKQGIADRLVFKKLRARTGGNLRFFVSGGAPLAKEIAEFFYAAGLTILEGYGLTETSPVIAVNTFEKFRPGSVGPPLPGVEVEIAADGEILTRSAAVMQGYYNNPEATAETIVNGWLHTGDIGHLDEDGFLFITDRKKDLIVTAGGKNVAPAPVENELKLSKYVGEAVVIGDKRKYLTALIVPAFETLEDFASRNGIAHASPAELIAHPDVQKLYADLLHRVNGDLASFEQIKYFRLVDHEFTLEGGQLTPSLKVKRRVVSEQYAELIEEMYQE